MGQILHGRATTTEAVRRAIQHGQESIASRDQPENGSEVEEAPVRPRCPMGPKDVRSAVLTPEEEAAVVALRRYTLLPLGDCLHALQNSIAHLTRSSLHRCFQRHDISRLPEKTQAFTCASWTPE